VRLTTKGEAGSRWRAVRDILIYGVCGGVLILALKVTEYRFLVVEHSVEKETRSKRPAAPRRPLVQKDAGLTKRLIPPIITKLRIFCA